MQAKFKAKKSLGQHFLRSGKAISQIVKSVDRSTKTVFEIGPGEGVLTSKLLEAGHRVIAIELDRRSVEILEEDYKGYIESGQLKIINKNCLDVVYSQEMDSLEEEYVLVGNIPYYITGAIFRHTFEQEFLPKQAIFLVQKEVAQRVVAKEKGKEKKESLLSVSVKIFTENPEIDVEIVDIVKAGSFVPPPKVDSAILSIRNITNPFANKGERDLFFEILKAGFKQKRKYLLSNLKNNLDQELFSKVNGYFTEKERAEDIDVKRWTILFRKTT